MSGWIAELRQRLGIKAPEASPPAPAGAAPDKEPAGAPTPAAPRRRKRRSGQCGSDTADGQGRRLT